MKYFLNLFLTLILAQRVLAIEQNIICYYDASSENRQGSGHFSLKDLENSLEFCTHAVYGYAGINSKSLKMISLNEERDIGRKHFSDFTNLKEKYPHIKFLLSFGGDKDVEELHSTNKYIELLEADTETQKLFIDSVVHLLRTYKFDGLDLAFQFPQNKHTSKGMKETHWKSLRNFFNHKLNETVVIGDHKTKFTLLVESLRAAFEPHDLMLSLTVLPNVNPSLYLDAFALINNLDFITLQTFDFTTPELNPTEATYTAPLYSLPVQGNRNVQHSVDYQVNYWISQRIPSNKINLGIAAYGRAWKMTKESKTDGYPKVLSTDGPAPATYITKLPGVITWTEICPMLPNSFNANRTGSQAPLLNVLDPHKDFVTYAFRPANDDGEHGMWISYDDPRIVAIKAAYVKHRNLGGVALYDVSLDDVHGVCNGDTFPMLRYIKYAFLQI